MRVLLRHSSLVGVAVLLLSCGRTGAADELPKFRTAGSDALPGRYIVVLNDVPALSDTGVAAAQLAARYGGELRHVYRHALSGFSVRLDERSARALSAHPLVRYVSEDAQVALVATETQPDPPSWGLDRVDQRQPALDRRYGYSSTGRGVNAYVIDTGIYPEHRELAGRATIGADFIGDGQDGRDCHGHGTHVAGTIGAARHGVAKDVALIGVRVLDCAGSGSFAGVIAGVDWVTANHRKPAVANMSLGGPVFPALDEAVANSVRAGVSYVVAAGNSADDACGHSPARAQTAVTVAASDRSDARASFSSFGPCVDVFAPGDGIASTFIGSENATATLSGTSMASPHVAGVVALYLQTHTQATPEVVTRAIIDNATRDRISDAQPGSPNRLLYEDFQDAASVNGASFRPPLARDIIASAFGRALATTTQAATSSLPTELAGTTVSVRDSAGVDRLAPLFFVSPLQVNYAMPAGTALGRAVATIRSGDGSTALGALQLDVVAPGVFAANANGAGVAAAQIVRVKQDGSQVIEPVARFDPNAGRHVPVPIRFTPGEQNYLVLYCTGLRHRVGPATLGVGGVSVPVTYASAQPEFVGLDQVNAGPLPELLTGRGEVAVELVVDGVAAGAVTVAFE
jgi:uncharacterized protein (TIGR03437 family)